MNTAVHETPTNARRVDQLLAHYSESHRHATNELIHFIAIPLIMLSLVGLMYALHPLVAYAFIAASMVYYVRLSLVFFITMLAGSALVLALVHAMGEQRLVLCAGIFVVAWIFQFIGHKLEGKKPSFFEDVQYLWVGPLFVLSKLFEKLGIRW
ncbi:MAG: Mpo1-like protein [Pseudomonadota bacterium]|nr:Mpo1-like protein [Pseudomonadota bacterium]